jgi:hypothetical protein
LIALHWDRNGKITFSNTLPKVNHNEIDDKETKTTHKKKESKRKKSFFSFLDYTLKK